jgi:hypothetical protein
LFALIAVAFAAPAPKPDPNVVAYSPYGYSGYSPYAYSYSNVYSYPTAYAYPSYYGGKFHEIHFFQTIKYFYLSAVPYGGGYYY